MPNRRGLLAPQNTFLDTIATRFDGTHSNFVLGNAQVPALYPIVYCSDGFCELTGYARAQIMQKGCACKFLYGPETLDEKKTAIDESLEKKSELKLEVMFYKKNGTPFWCLLDIVPIKNEKGEVVLFLASHKDVTNDRNEEVHSSFEMDENDMVDSEGPPSGVYGRRRSRAVLYQLSGHYRQDKTKSKLKLNNNLLQPHATTPLPEYKTVSIQKSRFILTHYGMLKTGWDLVILMATVYVAVIFPYHAAFQSDTDKNSVPDAVVGTLFFMDIVLNFRTTYVNKKGEVVLCPRKIALNYIKGWFCLDLVAAIPFDKMLKYLDSDETTDRISMLKLVRLLRLARLLQKMDRYSQYTAMVLTLLMLCFTLVAHWLACVWIWIALLDKREQGEMALNETDNRIVGGIDGDFYNNTSWMYELAERFRIPVGSLSITQRYLTALYFTCSQLTSVGFGNVSANTNNEKIFSIVTMLIGSLMHATVFGNVTSIIQRMYSRKSLYQTKQRDLKDFLTLNRIPKELNQRMQDYFQTMWSMNHGIDIHETLKEFPEELRGDISMHIHREILSLPIFETAAQGCLKLLSLNIVNNFCAPGEYLVHRGDAVQYIYYLCNGSMEVVINEMVVAILVQIKRMYTICFECQQGKGDLVGCDIDMHLDNGNDTIVKSACDVKALTYCDLKSINIVGVVETLKLYPEYQQEFANDIKHDLTHNLREGYDSEEKELDYIPDKSILPSISEDDEERVSEEDDKSPGCTSPRSPLLHSKNNRMEEDIMGSPRWMQRTRERTTRTSDRLKPLSPTRHHRSTEELRQEESQSRLQLEKIDSQVTDMNSHVTELTKEIRSVMSKLESLSTANTKASPSLVNPSAKSIAIDVTKHLSPFTRSSPSVFVTTEEPLSPQEKETKCCRHVGTQTHIPINVPVAVLEAFVLAHKDRVLQLLGIDDTNSSVPGSPPYEQLGQSLDRHTDANFIPVSNSNIEEPKVRNDTEINMANVEEGIDFSDSNQLDMNNIDEMSPLSNSVKDNRISNSSSIEMPGTPLAQSSTNHLNISPTSITFNTCDGTISYSDNFDQSDESKPDSFIEINSSTPLKMNFRKTNAFNSTNIPSSRLYNSPNSQSFRSQIGALPGTFKLTSNVTDWNYLSESQQRPSLPNSISMGSLKDFFHRCGPLINSKGIKNSSSESLTKTAKRPDFIPLNISEIRNGSPKSAGYPMMNIPRSTSMPSAQSNLPGGTNHSYKP